MVAAVMAVQAQAAQVPQIKATQVAMRSSLEIHTARAAVAGQAKPVSMGPIKGVETAATALLLALPEQVSRVPVVVAVQSTLRLVTFSVLVVLAGVEMVVHQPQPCLVTVTQTPALAVEATTQIPAQVAQEVQAS